jgi:hypothetical protein
VRGFTQTIKWRIPNTTKKWKGHAEIVMSVADPLGEYPALIDIRTKRTEEHPRGEGFTREGVRLSQEDAASLVKAITHALQELEEPDVTG